jgi:hypothetical protein
MKKETNPNKKVKTVNTDRKTVILSGEPVEMSKETYEKNLQIAQDLIDWYEAEKKRCKK